MRFKEFFNIEKGNIRIMFYFITISTRNKYEQTDNDENKSHDNKDLPVI